MSIQETQLATVIGEAGLIADGDWVESKDQDPNGDVRLIQLADVGDGDYIDKSNRFLTSEKATQLRCTFLKPGDILVSRMADPIGRACIFPGDSKPCVAVVDICVIRPDPNIADAGWLKYAINSQHFRGIVESRVVGATRLRISGKNLRSICLRIPSLSEQRRIVDLLSRAEGIVRLRREAVKKAAELIPALFVDMFGDPATNPKGWPIRKVSDFVSRFEGGKNILAGSENGSPYRILKVSAVTSGAYRETESKPSPDGYSPPVSHIVRAGDMLFSRANTEELVGATAIVERTDGKTLLPDKLWRFVWNEPMEQAYMHALFQSIHVRRELGKLSSGTSASMRNISQSKLFGLSLPIASFADQKYFAENVAAIRSIQSQQSAALVRATAAFDALLAKCFDQGAQPCPT